MPNMNLELLFDTGLLIGAIKIISRLLYIRINREPYLRKNGFKQGMIEYKNIFKVTSAGVICTIAGLTLLLIWRMTFVIHPIAHSPDPTDHNLLIFIPIGVILGYALIFYITRNMFKKVIPPKDKK